MQKKPKDLPSLSVIINDQIVFESEGNWLYPLFDLQEHIKRSTLDLSRAEVHDKVVGKAAALLLVRLGAGKVHGRLMSDLAVQALKRYAIPFTYDERVSRIDCKTEDILLNVDDVEVAYQILCKRANRC